MRGYHERPVHPALADRFVCTWVDRNVGRRHPVLPDACIDIVFDGRSVFVAGPDTGPVPITSPVTYVGIRFLPGGAPSMLGLSAEALLDRSLPLADLWGAEARALEDRLMDDPRRAAETLESAMLRHCSARTSEDALTRAVLRELGGEQLRDITVPTLARRLEISERNLRRRCTAAFGYGPKMLMRVLRFRRAVRLLQACQAPAEVAAATGFSDQPHMCFEFRRLAGASPSEVASGEAIVLTANGVD